MEEPEPLKAVCPQCCQGTEISGATDPTKPVKCQTAGCGAKFSLPAPLKRRLESGTPAFA